MDSNSDLELVPGRRYQLNVILHGLWALRVERDGIVAWTTDEHHHVKKAGQWSAPEFDLVQGGHRLNGVRQGVARSFSDQQNLVVTKSVHVLVANRHSYAVYLPNPRAIHSLRRFRAIGRAPIFEGSDVPARLPPEIAMVNVLVYDFDDPRKVTLEPLSWRPKLNKDGGTSNLHLFAQPNEPLTDPNHFKQAYKELAGMFGLDILPTRSGRAPVDKKTGIAGFPPNEERGLDERHPHGVSGSNCEMLVIDPNGTQ
jgi:hypothetical protein